MSVSHFGPFQPVAWWGEGDYCLTQQYWLTVNCSARIQTYLSGLAKSLSCENVQYLLSNHLTSLTSACFACTVACLCVVHVAKVTRLEFAVGRLKSHQAIAHILIKTDGNTFCSILTQVFAAGIFVIHGIFSSVYYSFAISTREFWWRTNAFVEVDVRDTRSPIPTIMIGTYVAGLVSVTIRSLVARPAETTIAIAADGLAAGSILTQVIITDVVACENVVASQIAWAGSVAATGWERVYARFLRLVPWWWGGTFFDDGQVIDALHIFFTILGNHACALGNKWDGRWFKTGLLRKTHHWNNCSHIMCLNCGNVGVWYGNRHLAQSSS